MSLTRTVGRNTIIQFGGKIISTALGLVTIALFQRYLQPDGFGVYTIAMAYVGFFSVIADLGLYLIMIRELNKPGADTNRVVGNLLGLRWTSAAIILTLSAVAAWFIPSFSAATRTAVTIASVSFLAVAGTQLLVGLFQTKMAMKYVTGSELAGRVTLLVATWWAIQMNGGLGMIMLAVVAGAAVNCGLMFYFARSFTMLHPRFEWIYWRVILYDTLPIAASIVLNMIYFKADTILLSLLRQGDAQIGLYGAAYKVLEILITFPSIFVGLLLPALGRAFYAQAREEFAALFQKGFNYLMMAAIPILVAGWLLAEPILVIIGRQSYGPAAPVLRLLLIAVVASFLNALSGHAVTIINRQRQMVWAYLGVAVVALGAYLLLIPRFHTMGAAWGTILSEALMAIIGYTVILKVMRFRLRLRPLLPIIASTIVMGGMIWLVRGVDFWLAAGLGSIVYLGMLLLTRTLSIDMIKQLVTRTTETDLRPAG